MLLLENITSAGLILPMIILVILFSLELGVALIQTYVFIICDFAATYTAFIFNTLQQNANVFTSRK